MYPEEYSVLVGTQDMLLSRALNRGYGSARARWPMEFAQLHHDCLWVLDEVQLMDVGLATSAQMQAFRDAEAPRALRPVRSWWMSATMQDAWFDACRDLRPRVRTLSRTAVDVSERKGPLWNVTKSVEIVALPHARDASCEVWADLIVGAHRATSGGITLAVANSVRDACNLYHAVGARLGVGESIDVRLVHSRFRGLERTRWAHEFLSRKACQPGANRIIIATQVVEAGVDMSADVLITQVAPWPSLVQRFGRCARYGGSGRIIVVDRFHTEASSEALEPKKGEGREEFRREEDRRIALPYAYEETAAAGQAISKLAAAGPRSLQDFEQGLDEARRAALYPYEPLHVLTRREFDDLFDTGPDLTGADVDISRFIRTGDERDVSIWWWPLGEGQPPSGLQPSPDLLCPVPIGDARSWLSPRRGNSDEPEAKIRTWVWDYLEDRWRAVRDRDLYPGSVVLVDSKEGGYDTNIGFTGEKRSKNDPPVPSGEHAPATTAALRADLAQDHEDLSISEYKTIATHGAEVADVAGVLARVLGLSPAEGSLLQLGARAHDLGKAHPVFVAAIRNKGLLAGRTDLAKAPDGAWHGGRDTFAHDETSGPRRGFRHEFVSTLALFELLWRVNPRHPALLGLHGELLEKIGLHETVRCDAEKLASPPRFGAELDALDPGDLDLVAWLVCAHHGKVRATWQGTPSDQEFIDKDGRGQPLRGVREGDTLPSTPVVTLDGRADALPSLTLHLGPAELGLSARYGASWVERVTRLRRRLGPFKLAYLETLLRVADVRASQLETPDPLLQGSPR